MSRKYFSVSMPQDTILESYSYNSNFIYRDNNFISAEFICSNVKISVNF